MIERRRPFRLLSKYAASGTAQQYAMGPSSRNISNVVADVTQLLTLPCIDVSQRKCELGVGTDDQVIHSSDCSALM